MNVIDIDELCEAKEKLLINEQQFFICVKQLGALIKLIQDGNFNTLTDILMSKIS
jgi:predicted RNA-binding protein associated with RNAse of E/G family